MADAVLGQIFDWIYGKLAGFFSEFFEMMNMMGAELFDLPWTQAVVLFFSRFAWVLYAVGLVAVSYTHLRNTGANMSAAGKQAGV